MFKIKLKLNTDNFSIVFILINLFAFIRMFYFDLRIGAFTSLIATLLILAKPKLFIKQIDLSFFILICIEIISMSNYILNDISHEVIIDNKLFFIKAINYILIPQIFFYILGKNVAVSDYSVNRNMRRIVYLNVITIFIGIVLLQFKPDFYKEYVQESAQQLFYNNTGRFYPRLISYLDTSMIVGVIAAFSTVLAYIFLENKIIRNLSILILVLGCLLTLSRGAWLALALSVFIMNLKYSKNPISLIFRIVLVGLLIVLLYKIADYFTLFVKSEMENKIGNAFSAVTERVAQWKGIIVAIIKNPMGFGLGLTSHKGVNIGFSLTVPDGNYFRILGDIGILGFIYFIFFLIKILYKSFYNNFAIFLVLFIFCFQAIGTNVFDLYYASYFFWFFAGIANKKD